MQPFDSVCVRAVANELAATATGARIDRVYVASTGDAATLQLRTPGGTRRLLVSIRGPFSRIHYLSSHRKMAHPQKAPLFCMLLRKHLEGARIREVRQPGLERALALVCTGFDELGDPVDRVLLAELTGKHSNLILLEAHGTAPPRILGALRPVGEQMSRERQILPGLPYVPPPITADRLDPLTVDGDRFLAVLARPEAGNRPLGKLLGTAYHSLSQVAIGQLCKAAGLDPSRPLSDMPGSGTRLREVWERAMADLACGRFCPRMEAEPNWDFSLWCQGDSRQSVEGPSDLFDRYYGDREAAEQLAGFRQKLAKEVDNRLTRPEQRVERLEQALSPLEAEAADRFRRWGEALLAFGHGIPRGAAIARLPDPMDPDGAFLEIPLDPASSVAQNAARYFKRYGKARTARELNQGFLDAARAERDYWQSVTTHLELADDLEALQEIAQEIGLLPDVPARSRKGPSPEAPSALPARFVSPDGWEILVGRNNRQNDRLTMGAKPHDWWFHTQNIPGSHVLVRNPGKEPLPVATRDTAALLAAYYSKGRGSSKVPVVYTRRRHVRKPGGARPGYVIYDHEEVVWVTPEAGLLPGSLARPEGSSR